MTAFLLCPHMVLEESIILFFQILLLLQRPADSSLSLGNVATNLLVLSLTLPARIFGYFSSLASPFPA